MEVQRRVFMKVADTTAVLSEMAIGFFKKSAHGGGTSASYRPKCCHSRLRPSPAAANMRLK